MADTIKSQFYLSSEAMAIINASATDKRRGEWLSRVVVEYHALLHPPVAVDATGLQETILARLEGVERQNAMILERLERLIETRA